MKKVLLYTLAMCAMLVFTACSGSDNNSNDNETGYATYKEALAANDFESAHKIIAQAEADNVKLGEKDFEKKYGIKYIGKGIEAAKEEIFDKEVKFLAANGSPEANARLVFLFSDFEIKGKKLPVGLNSYYYVNNEYPKSVSIFNSKLSMVLDLAISQDNKELAQKIIKLYKENMDVFEGGHGHSADDKNGHRRYFEIAPDGTEVDGNHCYVTYSWKDKEAAQKKYEENFGSLNETEE